MEYLKSTEIQNLSVKIQCTFANAYAEPLKNKGLCIISYDREMLKRKGSTDLVIGKLTGYYFEDENGVIWLNADLKHCNRMPNGWFREMNIWHEKKGVEPPIVPEVTTTKKSWLAWLTAGITALSFLR